jgi:FKBP-type peptidyl-prolyl cis-trans isomerase FkpA
MGDHGRGLARCSQTKVKVPPRHLTNCTAILVVAVIGGCNGSPNDVLGSDCVPGEEVVAQSELVYEELECGEGTEATHGDALTVRYTGRLSDGTIFDETEADEPFDFLLDSDVLIAGWSEGVTGMREGGRRRLVIPPELGYGRGGLAGIVPPDETLTYVVELVDVRQPD